MSERDELARLIDGVEGMDRGITWMASDAADRILKAGFRKAPAASEDVAEKARAAIVAILRPELVEMDIARIDRDDDGEMICDSPEVLDGAARRLANRAVEAVAGLLASHPVTDETVEPLATTLQRVIQDLLDEATFRAPVGLADPNEISHDDHVAAQTLREYAKRLQRHPAIEEALKP